MLCSLCELLYIFYIAGRASQALAKPWRPSMRAFLDHNGALVPGGPRGPGLAIIRCLAGQGAVGSAVDRQFPADSEELPSDFITLEADVTDEQSIRNAIEATVEKFGR